MLNVSHIDHFQVIRLLGQGGQGEVVHVRDASGREFALKWLLPLIANKGSTDRFLREFHSISQLSHPNIIKVFEQGQFLQRPYFTMELVRGDDLESFLQKEENHEVYYDILIQVCDALAYIHDHRLVHRDLKPSNILIDNRGQIKLMDFGLVKNLDASIQLTQADKFFGTMSYASPEQLMGEKIDYRSDLYSLGIVIYRMFSGQLPFRADSLVGMVTQHLSVVPTPLIEIVPHCPPALSNLCDILLKKTPLDRNTSASDSANIIRNINPQHHFVVKTPPASVSRPDGYRLRLRFMGRNTEMEKLIGTVTSLRGLSMRIISGIQGIGKSRLLHESLKASIIAGNPCSIVRFSGRFGAADGAKSSFFHFIAKQISTNFSHLGDLAGILPEIAPLHPAFRQFEQTGPNSSSFPGGNNIKHKLRYLSALIARMTLFEPWHIVWEDIHLADEFEIECLVDLIELSLHERIRCCIWATIRPDDFESSRESSHFTSQFNELKDFNVIDLKPLKTEDAQKVIAALINKDETDSIVSQLAVFSHGNPSVILQTIQHWLDNGQLIESQGAIRFAHETGSRETMGPILMRDIVAGRINSLSKQTIDVLTWICVLEQDAWLEVLRYAMQFPEKDLLKQLNELIFEGLIVSQTDSMGEHYAAANPSIRQAVLNLVNPEQLKQFHTDVVAILELMGKGYANPHRLGYHHARAGNPAAACRCYYTAAFNAKADNQIMIAREEVSHCMRLLNECNLNDSRVNQLFRIKVLLLNCSILTSAGSMNEKERLVPELLDLLPKIHDFNSKSSIYRFAVTVFTFKYDFKNATRLLQEYEHLLHHEANRIDDVYYSLQGLLSYFQNDFETANRFMKKALIVQKTSQVARVSIAGTMFMLAKTLTAMHRFKASFLLLRHAFKMLPAGKALRDKALLLAEMGNLSYYQNQTGRAVKYIRKALTINKSLGMEYQTACNYHDLALCFYNIADLPAARHYVDEFQKIDRILKNPRESLMGTMTSISIAVSMAQYEKAVDDWQVLIDTFGEQLCFERKIDLAMMHHRTLAMCADANVARQLLFELIPRLKTHEKNYYRQSLRYLLLHQRLAENDLRSADRLCRKDIPRPDGIFDYVPEQLLHLIIRIHLDPDGDHREFLEPAALEEMTGITHIRSELTCLRLIRSLEIGASNMDQINRAIELCPALPSKIWMLDVLAYFLRRLRRAEDAAAVQRRIHDLRLQMAQKLPETMRQHFLSKKIIIRV